MSQRIVTTRCCDRISAATLSAACTFAPDDGPTSSRGAELDLAADGEARLYRGAIYGIGRAALAGQLTYVADIEATANATLKNTQTTADLQLAIGGGYGRVLDIGAQIRVQTSNPFSLRRRRYSRNGCRC